MIVILTFSCIPGWLTPCYLRWGSIKSFLSQWCKIIRGRSGDLKGRLSDSSQFNAIYNLQKKFLGFF